MKNNHWDFTISLCDICELKLTATENRICDICFHVLVKEKDNYLFNCLVCPENLIK